VHEAVAHPSVQCNGLGCQQWRSKAGPWGPRALGGTFRGVHFADQKLIFERSLKVLVFRYYFKYIFYRFSIFMFRSSRLVG